RLAAVAEPLIRPVRVLEDVQHRLALVGEPPVRLVQVAHDVHEGAAALFAFLHPRLEAGDLLAERARFLPWLCGHQADAPSLFSFSFSCCRSSRSFSRAIIFSSRPTTTSSNFSRSRIFSWSSVLDCSRSRTTSSYARISLSTPIAPITFPSVSRSAEAFSDVGITSPAAARGLRRAF